MHSFVSYRTAQNIQEVIFEIEAQVEDNGNRHNACDQTLLLRGLLFTGKPKTGVLHIDGDDIPTTAILIGLLSDILDQCFLKVGNSHAQLKSPIGLRIHRDNPRRLPYDGHHEVQSPELLTDSSSIQ